MAGSHHVATLLTWHSIMRWPSSAKLNECIHSNRMQQSSSPTDLAQHHAVAVLGKDADGLCIAVAVARGKALHD